MCADSYSIVDNYQLVNFEEDLYEDTPEFHGDSSSSASRRILQNGNDIYEKVGDGSLALLLGNKFMQELTKAPKHLAIAQLQKMDQI